MFTIFHMKMKLVLEDLIFSQKNFFPGNILFQIINIFQVDFFKTMSSFRLKRPGYIFSMDLANKEKIINVENKRQPHC
jgi:hypothetical protein